MALTPIDVQQKTFGTALRGYDLDEVDDFLDEVVTTLKSYEERLAEAQERITTLEAELEGKGDSESAISRALVAAQRSADMIVEEAKAESSRILEDARAENERLASVRDEERAKLDVEVANLRSGIADIRVKVKELSASIESELDEMDDIVGGAETDLEPGDDTPALIPADARDLVDEEPEPADTDEPEPGFGTEASPEVVEETAEAAQTSFEVDSSDESDADESDADESDATAQMVALGGEAGDPLDAAIADATFRSWVPETPSTEEVDDGWAGGEDDADEWADEALPEEGEVDDTDRDAWERAGFEGWGDDESGDDKPRRPWE